MINIQRNFFVENILLEANLLDKNKIKNIPYKDYINTSVKEDLAIIFLDIDRIEAIVRTEIGNAVNKMTSKELKRDAMVFARNNPELFLELATDENINIRNKNRFN